MFETPQPNIDAILQMFSTSGALPRHPALAPRLTAIRTRLLAYLATDAQRVLVPDERVVLTAERQFRPEGAFARVFGAEVLVAALPGFLGAGWLPRQGYDARLQIRFAETLCEWIVARRLVDRSDTSCLIYEVRDAARDARASLRHHDGGSGARPPQSEGAAGRRAP